MVGNILRDNFKAFMESRNLKAHPWAQKAGVRSSTLYNYLNGTSETLSSTTLQKLAAAADVTVDELLGNRTPIPVTPSERVTIMAVIGVHGRVFDMDGGDTTSRPVGIPAGLDVMAARIDHDGLHPVPGGWLLFYEKAARDPQALLGKLAVVQIAGRQRLVREIRRGTRVGLYTLNAWNASALEDVEILSAHAVVAITQPVEPPVSPEK